MPSRLHAGQNAALDGVNRVAIEALFRAAPRDQSDELNCKLLECYLNEMFEAVLSTDAGTLTDVVKVMRCAQIGTATIAERYVPSVARRLGEAWVADTLDFGHVTIGSARLQGLLWKLEKDWAASGSHSANSPAAFLVGVPKGNQHTLGATILAGQLRRHGKSVNLDLELTPDRVIAHVLNQQLSGVLLSVAAGDSLAFIEELVDTSHHHSRITPVIIGGSILNFEDTISARTSADLVTSCIDEVLGFCDNRTLSQVDVLALSEDIA